MKLMVFAGNPVLTAFVEFLFQMGTEYFRRFTAS